MSESHLDVDNIMMTGIGTRQRQTEYNAVDIKYMCIDIKNTGRPINTSLALVPRRRTHNNKNNDKNNHGEKNRIILQMKQPVKKRGPFRGGHEPLFFSSWASGQEEVADILG